MAGESPAQAIDNFKNDLQMALGCLTAGRLSIPATKSYTTGFEYVVALQRGEDVELKGPNRISLFATQRFTVVETSDEERGPFKVRTTNYVYAIKYRDEEILNYHWTPDVTDGQRTYPHLHIGRSVVSRDCPVKADDFSHLHIPTGRVSIESIVRLLIEEFAVEPLNANWEAVIDDTEEKFVRYRTRS